MERKPPKPKAVAKTLFGGAKPRPETKRKRDERRRREAENKSS